MAPDADKKNNKKDRQKDDADTSYQNRPPKRRLDAPGTLEKERSSSSEVGFHGTDKEEDLNPEE
jgi:hypothetical protein